MGEEEKKPAEKKEDPPSGGGGEEKKAEGEAKPAEESKDAPPPPPPPPQEIVLRVFMHCEGCARKVRRSLKDFDGVEDVVTDCKTHMVVVKGEKADPVKVLERVQKKSHRQVELLSPIPAPAPAPEEEPQKPPPEEVAKPEEKKEEPQVITVVLKAHMHCEACAEAIKRRILRMKGVENVEPDFKGSEVTVKGVFDPQNLVDYVAKKTGKRAVVVKVEPKKEEGAGEGEKAEEEKKAEEGKDGDGGGEKKEGGESGGGEKKEGEGGVELPEDPKLEMKKHELYYYYPPIQAQYHHQRFGAQDGGYGYGYPQMPQMFSDENPNACSVM